MTVKELRDELKEFSDDTIVVMSSDAEGNSISPLVGVYDGAYRAESTWSGDYIVGKVLTPELKKQGYTEDDVDDSDDAVECVALWPAN